MTLLLNNLTVELQRTIFQKCSVRSLCRLRRANKTIDAIVEENRHQINARSEIQIILRFRLTWTRTNLTLRIEAVQEPLLWDFFTILKIQEIPEERFHLITDPYRQLSGIYINTVFFHADHFTRRFRIVQSTPDHIKREIEESALNEQRLFLQTEILPLFQQLRLRSQRLSVIDLFSSLIGDILCLLRGVSDIYIFTRINSSDIVALPLENVVERFYTGFMDTPRSIIPLIAGASHAFLQFYQKANLDHIVVDFLEELRQGEQEIGNLKCLDLRFQGKCERDLSETPGIECIWKGTICDFPCLEGYAREASAYTMRLTEETVVIFSDPENYHLHFVADADREVLFVLVSSWIFTLGAYDLSGLYDEFMAIENLPEAFATISGRYFS